MKTLHITGLHCPACEKLIGMELEDAGFKDKITTIRRVNTETGEIDLADTTTPEEQTKIIATINAMGSYHAQEKI